MEDILKSYWSMDSKELETEAIRLIREVIDSIEDDLDSRGSSLDFNIAKSFEFLTKAMVGIDYDVSDLEYQFYTNISTKLGFDVATKKDLAVINALGDETLLLVLKNVSTLCSFTDNAYELIVRYLFILGIYDGEFSDIEKNVIDYYLASVDEEVDLDQFIGKDRIVNNPFIIQKVFDNGSVSVTMSMSMSVSIEDDDDDYDDDDYDDDDDDDEDDEY